MEREIPVSLQEEATTDLEQQVRGFKYRAFAEEFPLPSGKMEKEVYLYIDAQGNVQAQNEIFVWTPGYRNGHFVENPIELPKGTNAIFRRSQNIEESDSIILSYPQA